MLNIDWKPKAWIAILLGIFLQPFTFLYLNRPRIFWLYFVLSLIASLIDWKYQTPFSLVFVVVCPIHAYWIQKHFVPSNERAWYSKWWGIPAIFAVLILFLVVALLVRSFLYEPFALQSSSMQPTIDRGDHVIVSKLGFGTYGTYGRTLLNERIASEDLVKRGSVYVFYPPHMDTPLVKRLIGLPGDRITFEDNQLVVNGAPLETNLLSETDQVSVYEQTLDKSKYTIQHIKHRPYVGMRDFLVPENSYFFLGDNRDRSSDSRAWGFVGSDRIIGEVVYVFH